MRIDGYSSTYSLDRSARSSATSAYRDAQREPVAPDAESLNAPHTDTSRQLPPVERPSNSADNRNQLFPSYAREPVDLYQPALSNRAAQALASYGSTANMVSDLEPMQVLGLDLYA